MSPHPHKQENSFSELRNTGINFIGATIVGNVCFDRYTERSQLTEESEASSITSQAPEETVDPILKRLATAISAVEQYAGWLVCTSSSRQFSSLTPFITDLEVQRRNLHQTLQRIEISGDSEGPMNLVQAIRHSTSSRKKEMISVVEKIDEMVRSLLEFLEVDELGKPKWSITNSDAEQCASTLSWDWKRIKKSFGHRKRAEFIDQLRRHNSALARGYEKRELYAADNPMDSSCFDEKRCSQVRKDVYVLYKALGSNCFHSHKIHIYLEDSDNSPPVFDIIFDLERHGSRGFHRTKIHIEQEKQTRDIKNFEHAQYEDVLTNSSSSSIRPRDSPLCICQLMQRMSNEEISLLCTDEAGPVRRKASVRKLHDDHLISPINIRGMLPRSARMSEHHRLSRKEKFGLAASIAWMVLHLGETPWLGPKSALESLHMFLALDSTTTEAKQPRDPHISLELKGSTSTTAYEQTYEQKQIPNLILFRLGIVLIELCLSQSFSELRQEHLERNQLRRDEISDYEVAVELIDDIYLSGGGPYGYAVQRCIGCQFPGRTLVRRLNFPEFRQHFYEGVVAPIKKTYDLTPA